jgi:hypothetical protein
MHTFPSICVIFFFISLMVEFYQPNGESLVNFYQSIKSLISTKVMLVEVLCYVPSRRNCDHALVITWLLCLCCW